MKSAPAFRDVPPPTDADAPGGFAPRPVPTPASPAASEWGYGAIPLEQWLGEDEPDEDDASEWHIRGLVARDVAQFMAGDPKVGKTMIMESWAVALALGSEAWCGFPIFGRKRVLVMPREDSERTTKIRLWQLARGAGLQRPHDLSEWLTVDPASPLNLASPGHIRKLREAAARYDVIFVDSFTTAHLGDENSVRDIAQAMEPARDLAIGSKTSLVFVHHYNGKGNGDDRRGVKHRLRGSSALAGYARHIVGVSHGPKRGMLEIATDGNLAYQVEPTVVELVKGETPVGKQTLGYQLVGSALSAAIDSVRDEVVRTVEESDDGYASANAIWKALGGKRSIVMAAVKAELVPDGRLEKRGKRIYSRTLVPGTSGNQQEPGTGTGTAPFKGAPGTSDDSQEAWWDR